MKKIAILIVFFSTQLVLANNTSPMSECYGYHTLKYDKVLVKDNSVVFQHTIKDPNNISYVSRETIVLNTINSKEFKLIAEDKSSILFSTIDGYFIATKDISEIRSQGVYKIGSKNSITQTVGTNFICKNGVWYCIIPIRYKKEIIKNKIEKMPQNLELLIEDALREGTIYKNKDAVYIFNSDSLSFRKIKDLNGSQVEYVKLCNQYKEYFLYDNDNFYHLDYNHLFDYTNQFMSMSEFTSFKNAEIIYNNFDISINTNDGFIWMYLRYSITNENGVSKKIIPIKANYLGANKEFISYNGNVYNDFNDIIRDNAPINVDAIVDINTLDKDENFYSDQKSKYLFDYDTKTFNAISWLPVNTALYPYNNTYGYLGNSNFYANDNHIYFLSDPKKEYKTLNHTSAIKDLKLAYAYDDKLLIENNEIENIADRETMSFLGSKVNVVRDCDGGRGQYPVVIDVYYFFKDTKSVYAYNTSSKKMRKLESQNIKDTKTDDYEYLSELMSLFI